MDKKKAAAATMAGVIAASGAAIDGAFDSPSDILRNDQPEPVVEPASIDDGGSDQGEQDQDKSKRSGARQGTLREKILELPLAVRVIFVVPLWAIGHVAVMGGELLFTALSPFLDGVLSFLTLALVMFIVFVLGVKLMFPDIPLRKIINRHTIKGVLIASGLVFAADFALPFIWPEYTRWKFVVLGGLSLIAIGFLAIRFGRKEEKRRAEEMEAEIRAREEEEGELLYVSSMGQSFTMRRPKKR